MKNKKKYGMSKEFASYEILSGFRDTLVSSVFVAICGFLVIFLGNKSGFDMSEFGFIMISASLFLLIYGVVTLRTRRKRFYLYMQRYSFCVEQVTKTAVESFIHPIVVISNDGEIRWCNDAFLDMIGRDVEYGEYVQDVLGDFVFNKYAESYVNVIDYFEHNNRHYQVNGRAVKSNDEEIQELIGIYFVDISELTELARQCEDKELVESIVVIDNYDEVFKETPNSNHGALLGEIEKRVNAWVLNGGGIVRRYEREKFIVMFKNKDYRDIVEKGKYKILDEIREINLENKIPVTLSIGTGIGGVTLEENDSMAKLALEMALGRGGDQVVVKSPSAYKFYGAKSREVEKSTKVKARVMAHALRELIDRAENVMIMGHKNGDMDSLGSAIGLFQAVESRNVDTYIVVKKNTSNAKELLSNFTNNPKYSGNIISGDKAMSLMHKQTLLIVVDTHRRSMVEYPEVLSAAKSVVLIDHHRRAEDFIDNAVLTYHEPYASSTCEMVTEILQYIQDTPKISVKEAEALYAGIFLDTKGFTLKTGVRTFEAAAYLRRMGVDPTNVRKLFKSGLEDSVRISKIVAGAKLYKNNIAVAVSDDTGKDSQIVVAKAADELLNIAGIDASFVLAKVGNKICISGRSVENINVQLILEMLGGGGHITIAGAQIDGSDMERALFTLYDAIDKVVFDSE